MGRGFQWLLSESCGAYVAFRKSILNEKSKRKRVSVRSCMYSVIIYYGLIILVRII